MQIAESNKVTTSSVSAFGFERVRDIYAQAKGGVAARVHRGGAQAASPSIRLQVTANAKRRSERPSGAQRRASVSGVLKRMWEAA